MASNINNFEVALFGEFFAKDLSGQLTPVVAELLITIRLTEPLQQLRIDSRCTVNLPPRCTPENSSLSRLMPNINVIQG